MSSFETDLRFSFFIHPQVRIVARTRNGQSTPHAESTAEIESSQRGRIPRTMEHGRVSNTGAILRSARHGHPIQAGGRPGVLPLAQRPSANPARSGPADETRTDAGIRPAEFQMERPVLLDGAAVGSFHRAHRRLFRLDGPQ